MQKTFITLFLLLTTSIFICSFKQTQKKAAAPKTNVKGKEVYATYCQSCHMENGEGLEGVFPPLAKTTYLKDAKKNIKIVLEGQQGPIIVNGKTYDNVMPPLNNLTNDEVANVLNYVRTSWGNKYPTITAAQVKALRK
jgi:mono/diheme cytochrome c family protein